MTYEEFSKLVTDETERLVGAEGANAERERRARVSREERLEWTRRVLGPFGVTVDFSPSPDSFVLHVKKGDRAWWPGCSSGRDDRDELARDIALIVFQLSAINPEFSSGTLQS